MVGRILRWRPRLLPTEIHILYNLSTPSLKETCEYDGIVLPWLAYITSQWWWDSHTSDYDILYDSLVAECGEWFFWPSVSKLLLTCLLAYLLAYLFWDGHMARTWWPLATESSPNEKKNLAKLCLTLTHKNCKIINVSCFKVVSLQ